MLASLSFALSIISTLLLSCVLICNGGGVLRDRYVTLSLGNNDQLLQSALDVNANGDKEEFLVKYYWNTAALEAGDSSTDAIFVPQHGTVYALCYQVRDAITGFIEKAASCDLSDVRRIAASIPAPSHMASSKLTSSSSSKLTSSSSSLEQLHIRLGQLVPKDYLLDLDVRMLPDGSTLPSAGQVVSNFHPTRFVIRQEPSTTSSSSSSEGDMVAIHIKSPNFDKSSSTLTFVASPATNTSNILFGYSLEDVGISQSELDICIKIVLYSSNEEILRLSCLDLASQSISLSNIRTGRYTMFLVLREKASGSLLMGTYRTVFVDVASVLDNIPNIALEATLIEGAVQSVEVGTSEAVKVFFSLVGISEELSKEHWQVCAAVSVVVGCEIHNKHDMSSSSSSSVDSSAGINECTRSRVEDRNLFDRYTKDISSGSIKTSEVVPLTCLDRGSTHLSLSSLSAGFYEVKLFVALQGSSKEVRFERSPAFIDVRVMQEFVPSYDWQVLHAWNSIPSGIETRLPLSGHRLKDARIPNPWSVQLAMPDPPCRFFLRMKIADTTTVGDILLEASKLCLRPVANFGLQLISNGNKGGLGLGLRLGGETKRVFHFNEKDEEANTDGQLDARRLDFFNSKLKLVYTD